MTEDMGKNMQAGRKYETVIFDLDGTLLDTLDDLTDAVNYGLKRKGMPERTITEVRGFVGNGVKRLLEQSVPEGTCEADFTQVYAYFREYYSVHCNDKTHAYDGVIALMEELKKEGYALAIVSNKLDVAVKELAEIYFKGLVGAAIGEMEGVAKKPAPDTVYKALEELHMPKETAVYVGDSEVDIMTAENAGLPCVSVLWGFRERELLETYGASCFAEMPWDVKNYL